MRTLLKISALVAMVAALTGCKGTGRAPLLPNVSGKAGEIVVVIDKDNWEGDVGNAIREILATDCPYLAPVPFRGKKNSSLYLPYVVDAIAQIKGMDPEEVISRTEENAERLYRLRS